MPPAPVELDHGHRPVGDVLLQRGLLHLQMETRDPGQNVHRPPLIRPALELPGLAHDEHGDHALPLRVGEAGGVVEDAVGDGQPALLPPLDQHVILALGPGTALVLGRDELQILQQVLCIEHGYQTLGRGGNNDDRGFADSLAPLLLLLLVLLLGEGPGHAAGGRHGGGPRLGALALVHHGLQSLARVGARGVDLEPLRVRLLVLVLVVPGMVKCVTAK